MECLGQWPNSVFEDENDKSSFRTFLLHKISRYNINFSLMLMKVSTGILENMRLTIENVAFFGI